MCLREDTFSIQYILVKDIFLMPLPTTILSKFWLKYYTIILVLQNDRIHIYNVYYTYVQNYWYPISLFFFRPCWILWHNKLFHSFASWLLLFISLIFGLMISWLLYMMYDVLSSLWFWGIVEAYDKVIYILITFWLSITSLA